MSGQEGEARSWPTSLPDDGREDAPTTVSDLADRFRANRFISVSPADRRVVYLFLTDLADRLGSLATEVEDDPPVDENDIATIRSRLDPITAQIRTYLSDRLNVFDLVSDDETGLFSLVVEQFVGLHREIRLAIADFEDALGSPRGSTERKEARRAVVERLQQCHATLRAMLPELDDWAQ